MVRSSCILAIGLFAVSALGAEPIRPLRIVLVYGTDAEFWVTCLGQGCVQVEPLVPKAIDGDEWTAAVKQVERLPWPDALVTGSCDDDQLPRFWSERLQGQRRVETLAIRASHVLHSTDHECRCLVAAHRLLVELCPEAKATLDDRLRSELQRRLPLLRPREPLARR